MSELRWEEVTEYRWHLWRGERLVVVVTAKKKGGPWYVDVEPAAFAGQPGVSRQEAMAAAESVAAMALATQAKLGVDQ